MILNADCGFQEERQFSVLLADKFGKPIELNGEIFEIKVLDLLDNLVDHVRGIL